MRTSIDVCTAMEDFGSSRKNEEEDILKRQEDAEWIHFPDWLKEGIPKLSCSSASELSAAMQYLICTSYHIPYDVLSRSIQKEAIQYLC